MIDVPKIEAVASEIAVLLRTMGIKEWAAAFQRFAAELPDDPERVAWQILATFGGMGSFNDLILYRDGQPLAAENRRLDALREKLFHLCRGQVAAI